MVPLALRKLLKKVLPECSARLTTRLTQAQVKAAFAHPLGLNRVWRTGFHSLVRLVVLHEGALYWYGNDFAG